MRATIVAMLLFGCGKSGSQPSIPPEIDAGTQVDAPSAEKTIPYMIGVKADGALNAATTVASWLGRPIDIVGATITTTGFLYSNPNAPYQGTPLPVLDISFPLLSCWNGGDAGAHTDLGVAATGGYNSVYQAMANKLVALQNQTAVVAVGWEMSGNWYCWSHGSTGGQNATFENYVAAYKQAAETIRATFQAAGKPIPLIEFCWAWGQEVDPTSYWPGKYDATTNPGGADAISADVYQANVSHYNNGGVMATWPMIQSNIGLAVKVTYNLDWMTAFATQQNVLVGMREYGAGGADSGGGGTGGPSCSPAKPGVDDPSFYTDALIWLEGLGSQAAYNIIADDPPADDFITPGCNPAEQASWTSYYPDKHFDGTWWQGQAVP